MLTRLQQVLKFKFGTLNNTIIKKKKVKNIYLIILSGLRDYVNVKLFLKLIRTNSFSLIISFKDPRITKEAAIKTIHALWYKLPFPGDWQDIFKLEFKEKYHFWPTIVEAKKDFFK